MRRPTEDPVITKGDGNVADWYADHPAFGQIEVVRTSTGGMKNILYGSHFDHPHTITLRIMGSRLARNLSGERYSDLNQIIEVEMTESQFASLSSCIGVGGGVPCTLRWTEKSGALPRISPPVRSVDIFTQELEQVLQEADNSIQQAVQQIAALPISQKKKDELLKSIGGVGDRLKSSATFVADRFEEHTENVTEHAKQEILSFANNLNVEMPERLDATQGQPRRITRRT